MKRFALRLLLSVTLAACCPTGSWAQQTPGALSAVTEQTPPPQANAEARPLEPWQEDLATRLKAVEDRIKELETQGEEIPAPLRKQRDLLTQISVALSQIVTHKEEAAQAADDHAKLEAEYETALQELAEQTEPSTFLELEKASLDLMSERRRLERLADQAADAAEALDKARQETRQANTARRQAKEKLDGAADDEARLSLAAQHAEAVLAAELAEATERLREVELAGVRQANETQKLRVKLLEQRVVSFQATARFTVEELNEIGADLDVRENNLRTDVATAEGSATQLRRVDEQWTIAQKQLDEAEGDFTELRRDVDNARILRRRSIQERLPLLQDQLKRVSEMRDVWQHRQRVFTDVATRLERSTWTAETTETRATLLSAKRVATLEIEELRSQLIPLRSRRENATQAAERFWLDEQIESLEQLIEMHQTNLATIDESLRLHERLLDELEGDSLTAAARNHLMRLWNGIQAVWNYELAVVGDDSAVTVQKVVTALLLIAVGYFISRLLSRSLGRQVLRRFGFDPSATATIQSLVYYVLLIVFALLALKIVKVPLTAFTVLGGAVALGIGFGSQNIINNFISGLILLAERPVKVGDLIQLGDLYGNVEHIGARSTRVRTGSNLEIIVPNSTFLQNNVINFTLSSDKVRTQVEVGVVYGSPTVTVTQLLRRAVVETGRVSKDPPPIILFTGFGDNSLNFEVHFWIRMRTVMDRRQVESAVRYRIDQLFREEGVVIAFPQRDVHLDTLSPLQVQMVEPVSDGRFR